MCADMVRRDGAGWHDAHRRRERPAARRPPRRARSRRGRAAARERAAPPHAVPASGPHPSARPRAARGARVAARRPLRAAPARRRPGGSHPRRRPRESRPRARSAHRRARRGPPAAPSPGGAGRRRRRARRRRREPRDVGMSIAEALRDAEEIEVVTRGRRSQRPHRVRVWFAYDGEDIWLRTDRGTDWYRNLDRAGRCEIVVDGHRATAERVPVQDEGAALRRLVDLWRAKYGAEWVADWYVERGRVPV